MILKSKAVQLVGHFGLLVWVQVRIGVEGGLNAVMP